MGFMAAAGVTSQSESLGGSRDAAQTCLTVFQAISIQDFIFGSNRLRENLGASYLVWAALEVWLRELLAKCNSEESGPRDPGATSQKERSADLLFIGGGNAAVRFDSPSTARAVISAWSRQVMDKAPGLRVLAATVPCPTIDVRQPLWDAHRSLAEAKMQPALQVTSRPGIAVTRMCPSTGLPAVEQHKDPDGGPAEWLSPTAYARRQAADHARRRLESTLADDVLRDKWAVTDRLELLGQLPNENHVAIVHADGNSLGQRLRSLMDDVGDDEAIDTLRGFSAGVAAAAQEALVETLRWLAATAEALSSAGQMRLADAGSGRRYLPVRPIVFGGDDLTLVVEGRLGIAVAARYLEAFAKKTVLGQPVSACAGVAIVGTSFPFSRAYALAEDLCQSAKNSARADADGGSWLDFQLVLGSNSGVELDDMRQREFTTSGGQSLCWRPWRVDPIRGDGHDWITFEELSHGFSEAPWVRSRAKGLRDAIEGGPQASKHILAAYGARGIRLPAGLGLSDETAKAGWDAAAPRHTDIAAGGFSGVHLATPYFDVVEMLDFSLGVGTR